MRDDTPRRWEVLGTPGLAALHVGWQEHSGASERCWQVRSILTETRRVFMCRHQRHPRWAAPRPVCRDCDGGGFPSFPSRTNEKDRGFELIKNHAVS